MKRGTPSHPKTKRLCRALGIPTYAAVGILESLWLFASEYAPNGAIGRFSDADIADAIGWQDDAGNLVNALIECEWIEKHETHRLVIHDWQSHADDATNLKLARARQYFWNGDRPRYTRMSNAERAEITKDYDSLCAEHAHGVHTAGTRHTHENRPPSPPLPSPPLPAAAATGGIRGNPGESKDPDGSATAVDPERLRALAEVGIGEPKRSALAEMNLSLKDITRIAREVKEKGGKTGLLVVKLEEHANAPPPPPDVTAIRVQQTREMLYGKQDHAKKK